MKLPWIFGCLSGGDVSHEPNIILTDTERSVNLLTGISSLGSSGLADTKQPRFKMGAMLSRFHRLLYVFLRGRFVSHRGGVSFLLLTTRGRRTGRAWSVPLLYIMDGENPCVIASRGGHPKAPDWLLNIRHDGQIRVQIGSDHWDGAARIASHEERDRLWPRFFENYAGYEAYQARTSRRFPIVILTSSKN